jgi:signal peptidase II
MDMSAPTISFRESGLRWAWMAAIVVVLDQLTKYWVVSTMYLEERIVVLPVFDIFRTFNEGIAWSWFANAGGAQRWVISALAIVVSIVLVYWLRRLALATHTLLITGLTLILGGAIGNVIDRLRLGHVIDFLSAHWGNAYFPAFNVADSAITLGAVCVILDALRETLRERRLKREAASSGK